MSEKKEAKTEDDFKQKEIDPKSFCYVPTLIKTNTHNAPYPIRLTIVIGVNVYGYYSRH